MARHGRAARRAIPVILCVILLMAMFAGCNPKTPTSSQASSSEATTTAASSTETTAETTADTSQTEDTGATEDTSPAPDTTEEEATTTETITNITTQPSVPPDKQDANTVAQVKMVNGMPRLLLDNQPTEPIFFMPPHYDFSTNAAIEGEMKYAAQYGVKLIIYPYSPNYHDMPNFFNSALTGVVEEMLMYNPQAKLILRLSVAGSIEEYGFGEEEAAVLNGKTSNYVSMASDKWYEAAKEKMRNIVTNVMSDEFLSEHVVGFEIMGGNSAEWFEYDYWDGMMDTSESNRKGFARYLKNKYGNDAGLRGAWGDNTLTLETVKLPDHTKLPGIATPAAGNTHVGGDNVASGQFLLTDKANQIYVDYLDYLGKTRAERICGIAEEVKKASNNTKLAITYYGYHCDTPTASSAHFALGDMLKSPYIDMISGPVSYGDRNEGGIGAYMSFVDSVTAAGKMWVDEGDYRSPVFTKKPEIEYPKTVAAMNEVMERELAKCMVFGTGVWWLDLNGAGWFNYESFWKRNANLSNLMYNYNLVQKKKTPDICVILDESAVSLVGNAQSYGANALIGTRASLYRSGYSYGMYLIDDLISGKIDDAKVYVLLNPWRLSDQQAAAVEKKVHRAGKTTLYAYGNGLTSEASFNKLTGMTIHSLRTDAVQEISMNLKAGLDKAMTKDSLGVNPIYYVDATNGVQSLGTYASGAASGKTGLASYSKDGWTSVFYGGTNVTAAMLQYLASTAGVHQYAAQGDVFHTDGKMAVLHASTAGEKTVKLPARCDIFNMETGKWSSGSSINLGQLTKGQTVILLYGKKEELRKVVG